MSIDKGADFTVLWDKSKAAQGATAITSTAASTMSGNVSGHWWPKVPLEVGGTSREVTLFPAARKVPCGEAEGVLGMDVLRHCATVWTDNEVWLGCPAI